VGARHFFANYYQLQERTQCAMALRDGLSYPSFLRRQESSDLALDFLLGHSHQRAAYAAGVSIACRRSSHFSFAGPKEK
jgi:hypothetical protein